MKQRQIKAIVTILMTIIMLIIYVKPSMAISSDLLSMQKPIGQNIGRVGLLGNKNPVSSSNNIDTIDKVIQSGNDFLDSADDNTVNFSEKNLQKLSKFISGVLLAIAIGVTVISAIILGINFTVQSIDEKAKIKESMVPWIIGIFIAFGAFAIWKMTMNFFMKL